MARSVKELALRLTTDVSDFAKGTQDAADDTDDLARNVEQATEKIAGSFKDLTQDAQRATDEMARNSKAAFSKVSTDAAHEMGSGTAKESFGEAGGEVGAEFASNLGESLSSGDLTGLAKDTAGGLVGAFQGIGGGIGIGLATAAATATAIFATMQADAKQRAANIAAITTAIFDKLTEDMQSALDQMLKGQAWNAFVQSFAPNGSLADGMRNLGTDAKNAGTNVGQIAAAFFNGGKPAAFLNTQLQGAAKAGEKTLAANKTSVTVLDKSATAAQKIQQAMNDAATGTQNANEAARLMWEAMIGISAEARIQERSTKNSVANIRQLKTAVKPGKPGTVVGGRVARD